MNGFQNYLAKWRSSATQSCRGAHAAPTPSGVGAARRWILTIYGKRVSMPTSASDTIAQRCSRVSRSKAATWPVAVA